MILTHQVTIPYGVFLCLGGLIGFLKTGSVASITFASLTGGALLLLGFLSRRDFLENEEQNQFQSATYSYCVLSLLIATVVTLVMGDRFIKSGNFMPPGMVAIVSLGMCIFYLYKLNSDDVGTHAKRAKRG